MSWISRKLNSLVVGRCVAAVVKWLDGKKTIIGAVNLLLWVLIYAFPAFTPDYNWVIVYATQIRDLLNSSGVPIDSDLFNAGVTFTVVGLVDKIRKLIKEYKDEREQTSRKRRRA